MIVKGFSISRGSPHATHLLKTEDNEHVFVQEVRGFVASDLHGAFRESEAIARGTKCKQHLFSCAFSPPDSAKISADQFMEAVDRTEHALGLDGQPRAVVFHEKDGRRHAHCVWSRIDAQTMKAKQLSHWKAKLGDVSRDLHREFGIEMPRGLQNREERSKLNFSQAESQMAKRQGDDPREIKALLQDCWSKSDDLKSFERALESHALLLAKGDKRGLVVLDHNGSVHSLSRALGIKAKDISAKIGNAPHARSVEAAKKQIADALSEPVRAKVKASRHKFEKRQTALKSFASEMVHLHRAERQKMAGRQSAEWEKATLERQARMPKGIMRAAWSWVTGETARIRANNEAEAKAQAARQSREREEMAARQQEERRVLQAKIKELRKAQAHELLNLRLELAPHLIVKRMSTPRQDVLAVRMGLKLER